MPQGGRLSYGMLNGLTHVDDTTLVQGVLGEQFTYELCVTTNAETIIMTQQLGTLEMDHALLAFLYNGLAEEMGGVAPDSSVGFWTGSDTDAVISWMLNASTGMLDGYKTLLLHTTSTEWNRGNITVVSDPNVLKAQLSVTTALMAGCDTIPSIPKLAHGPYFDTLPHISVITDDNVLYMMYDEEYALLGLRKRENGGSGRPLGIEVRWFMENCMAWWQTVLSSSKKLPLEQKRVECWSPEWRIRTWAWSLEYLANGWRGTTFFREHPPPGPHRYPLRQPNLAPAARRHPPPPRAGVAVGTHCDTSADGARDYRLRPRCTAKRNFYLNKNVVMRPDAPPPPPPPIASSIGRGGVAARLFGLAFFANCNLSVQAEDEVSKVTFGPPMHQCRSRKPIPSMCRHGRRKPQYEVLVGGIKRISESL